MRRWAVHRVLGASLVLLGVLVILDRWLQLSVLVPLAPKHTPMVFNAALSFVLAGGALLVPFSESARYRRITTAIGGALVTIAILMLAEYLFQIELGIDWSSLHGGRGSFNPKPGRMSPTTASGFLMGGLVLILAMRVRHPWTGVAVRLLTFGVGAIGVFGIAGYFVNASLLFPQYATVGVALATATGLVLLAVGLQSAWRRTEWGRGPLFSREDDRIASVGATVLASIALVSGIATFAVLQEKVLSLAGDNVLAALLRRTEVFRDFLELREVNARIAATRPAAIRNVRAIHAGRDDGSNMANLDAVVRSFVKQGFNAIAYHDIDGRVVASGGEFAAAPAMTVALATPDKAELAWNDGFLLRHRVALRDAEGEAGSVLTEQSLPVLTRLARDARGIGETGDMGLCVLRDDRLDCFPQRFNPQVFSTPLANVVGEPLPMTRALRGETGIVTIRDYRGQNVIAAYGPIGTLSLGMVVKIDAAEVFQPIREQLQLAAGVLLFLVTAGTVLLRWRVKPLARRLVEAEERFRAVADTASDAIISADSRGNVVYFNRAAQSMFGYAESELLGRPVTLLMPERFRAAHQLGLQRFVATGEARIMGKTNELEACRKGGVEFPMEFSLASWKTAEGRFFTAILRDTTARKRAENELKSVNTALEATNRELEAFSYSVSHDLRAPLRHVDGFADMLKEDHSSGLNESARHYIDVIRDSAKQMGRLIDDLLLFSRMGRVELRQEPVSMAELVEDARSDAQRDAGGREIEWRIEILPSVRGDRAMLKQVWINLLSNAVKYSRERKPARIEVGSKIDGTVIEFCVRDNGAGFDMKYAGNLFGVFQRLHHHEEFEGTGIGLANVRRIVARHGGRTWADGKPGQGASFYFTLPGIPKEGP